MKYIITYLGVRSDRIFAVPEPIDSEYVEASNTNDLNKYITSKKDVWGHSFKKNPDFDKKGSISSNYKYISPQGAVEVERYYPPKFKNI